MLRLHQFSWPSRPADDRVCLIEAIATHETAAW
jgi:hypothetical protein